MFMRGRGMSFLRFSRWPMASRALRCELEVATCSLGLVFAWCNGEGGGVKSWRGRRLCVTPLAQFPYHSELLTDSRGIAGISSPGAWGDKWPGPSLTYSLWYCRHSVVIERKNSGRCCGAATQQGPWWSRGCQRSHGDEDQACSDCLQHVVT